MDSLRRVINEALEAECEMEELDDPKEREALALVEIQLIATKRLVGMGVPASDYLMQIIQEYYSARPLKMPTTVEHALFFLMAEVGELADAFVEEKDQWNRNNVRDRKMDTEIADVLMMLQVTAKLAGIDPVTSLLKKMKEKGFDYLASSGSSGS